MLRAGIIGAGQKLRDTIQIISRIPHYQVSGIFSPEGLNVNPLPDNLYRRYFTKTVDLITDSEAIIVCNQSGYYEEIIGEVLKRSKHVMVFADTSLSSFQLEKLVKLAEEAGILLFIYHEDLKNRVPKLIRSNFGNPEFIDIYRNLDLKSVSNIYDVFYDEVFLVMKLNPVNPRKYSSASIPYYSDDPYLLNARIEFGNGTSANVTVNKFENKNKDRIEIFRSDGMASVHPETGDVKIIHRGKVRTEIFTNSDNYNSRKEGLQAFITYILSGNYTSDACENGIVAHRVASGLIHRFIPSAEKILFQST